MVNIPVNDWKHTVLKNYHLILMELSLWWKHKDSFSGSAVLDIIFLILIYIYLVVSDINLSMLVLNLNKKFKQG